MLLVCGATQPVQTQALFGQAGWRLLWCAIGRSPASSFLDHPGCGSHSPPAFWHSDSTGCAGFGFFFTFFSPSLSFALCLAKLLYSSMPVNTKHPQKQAEGGHSALGCCTWLHSHCWAEGTWKHLQHEQGNVMVTIGTEEGWLHFGHCQSNVAWKITGVTLVVTHKQNQGTYYFSPCLYHPAKKSPKNPPPASPRVFFTKFTQYPTCSWLVSFVVNLTLDQS